VRRVAKFVLVVAVVALAAAGYTRFAPVDAKNLTHSVVNGVGSSSLAEPRCDRVRPGAWRCVVDDSEGSENASTYDVRLRGVRCWTATRRPRSHVNPKLKRHASGGVRLRDRLRIL
jgi:5-methylcytosine-specific restriction endonuclease McrA